MTWQGQTKYCHYAAAQATILETFRSNTRITKTEIFETIEIQYKTANSRGSVNLTENSRNIFVPGDNARLVYVKVSDSPVLSADEIIKTGQCLVIGNPESNLYANCVTDGDPLHAAKIFQFPKMKYIAIDYAILFVVAWVIFASTMDTDGVEFTVYFLSWSVIPLLAWYHTAVHRTERIIKPYRSAWHKAIMDLLN